jgi:hypothetical protein
MRRRFWLAATSLLVIFISTTPSPASAARVSRGHDCVPYSCSSNDDCLGLCFCRYDGFKGTCGG